MPNRKTQKSATLTGQYGMIPSGHTMGKISASSGDVTLTFANGNTYVLADGENFPIVNIGGSYDSITVAAPVGVTAKCEWVGDDLVAVPGVPPGGATPSADPYQDVYDAFASKPSASDESAQRTFVETGVTDDWWDSIDRLFFFASHSGGADSLIDWIHPGQLLPFPSSATLVNAPTWTQYQGYTGDALSKYIDLNFYLNQLQNYRQNDAFAFTYVRSQSTNDRQEFGGDALAVGILWSKAGGVYMNDSYKGAVFPFAQTGGKYAERTLGASFDFYVNGVAVAGNPQVNASGPLNDVPIFALCQSSLSGGSPFVFVPQAFWDGQMSVLAVGKALGAVKQLSFYNAVQTLMTHYGTQV